MAERRAQNLADHDLLIELKTKVGVLQDSMTSLQTNLGSRVEQLEKAKVNYTDLAIIKETIEKNLTASTKETDRLESVKETKDVVQDLAKVVTTQGQNVDWVRTKIWQALGVLSVLQFLGAGLIAVILKAILNQ